MEQSLKTNALTVVSIPDKGISLAMTGAALGYRVILVMPGPVDSKKISVLSAYGAEIVPTDKEFGMLGALKKAEELQKKIQGFTCPASLKIPPIRRSGLLR